jgi:hypothetical protein
MFENYTLHINVIYTPRLKTQVFLMLKQAVHVVTTVLKVVNNC